MKKFKERGVICGDLFTVDGDLLGVQKSLVLISMRGFPPGLRPMFHDLLRQDKNVTLYSEQIGVWDYVIELCALRPREDNSAATPQLESNYSPANTDLVVSAKPSLSPAGI